MKSPDRTTLAALQALDSLDLDGQAWVDTHLQTSPEWLAEAEEFQAVVSLLAYSAPVLEMPDLKARLFECIGVQDNLIDVDRSDAGDEGLLAQLRAQAKAVQWENYQPTPGAQLGIFKIDSDKREVCCFVRSWGAVSFPMHRHAGEEEIIVLEGDLRIEEQSYSPGDRVRSTAGTAHQPKTDQGCLLYLRTSLDDEVLS